MASETDGLQRIHRLRLFHLFAAFLACPARIIVPEIKHCLTEMLDDIRAVEVDVFHQCSAVFAVENDVLLYSWRAAPLDHYPNRVGRALRRMRHIWRNEERLSLTHDVINNAITLADADFDVALELIEVLFRIHQMKIVPRVRPFDDHHEEIASVIKITVAHRRLELFAVLFDPIFQINRRLNGGHSPERLSVRAKRQTP